ncbi:hypothetical protein [uncultured Chryseobacterium sp.]|uniref:hypothetical protein n=1 Tax=uncultured Chryseobacterium sp. TaxID=259322 RepID=UPI0025EF3C08|nr:hypothetical protein [uncultured Chryseobacterium sp.]
MMTIKTRREKMNAVFTKYHIKGLPFDAVIHHFSAKDQHEHIHDHPFSFTSHILKGSYIERIYTIQEDGTYHSVTEHRKEGTSHFVPANTVHEIVELPEGECFTLIRPNAKEKEPFFYRFENGKAFRRQWNRRKFREIGKEGKK